MNKNPRFLICLVPFVCIAMASAEVQSPSTPPAQNPKESSTFVLETSIAAVYGDGKYLVMQDDSKWEIRKKDWNKTGGWLGPADVRITKSEDPKFPYKILNKWTNSTVYAKPVEEVTDQISPDVIP